MEQRTNKKLFLCTSSGGEKSLSHSGKTQVAPFARNQPFATFFERDLEINWGLFFPGVTLTFGALFLRHLLFSLRLFSPPFFLRVNDSRASERRMPSNRFQGCDNVVTFLILKQNTSMKTWNWRDRASLYFLGFELFGASSLNLK